MTDRVQVTRSAIGWSRAPSMPEAVAMLVRAGWRVTFDPSPDGIMRAFGRTPDRIAIEIYKGTNPNAVNGRPFSEAFKIAVPVETLESKAEASDVAIALLDAAAIDWRSR